MTVAKYKFNYEVGAEYLWNQLLKNKDIKKLTSKGFNRKKISNLINKVIKTAQNDTNHPLNFNNLPDARGFVGGKKIEADYYKVLNQSSTGIVSLLNDKEYRNLFNKGGVFSVVGDKSAEFVPGWTGSKGQGIIDAKITAPDGTVRNLSLKLGDALGGTPEPSQLLRHAENAVDRLNLIPEAAKQLKLDYSKALEPLKKAHEITLDLMGEYGFKTKVELDKFLKNNPELLTKVRRIQKPLIQQVQDSVQKLYDVNPLLSTEINKGITTGLGQYKETVDRVLTFGDKSTLWNPTDLQWFHRFSLGKGRVRPPALRLDFRRVPSLLRDSAITQQITSGVKAFARTGLEVADVAIPNPETVQTFKEKGAKEGFKAYRSELFEEGQGIATGLGLFKAASYLPFIKGAAATTGRALAGVPGLMITGVSVVNQLDDSFFEGNIKKTLKENRASYLNPVLGKKNVQQGLKDYEKRARDYADEGGWDVSGYTF